MSQDRASLLLDHEESVDNDVSGFHFSRAQRRNTAVKQPLVAVTYNYTAWSAAKRFLLATEAHVALIQETHITQSHRAEQAPAAMFSLGGRSMLTSRPLRDHPIITGHRNQEGARQLPPGHP